MISGLFTSSKKPSTAPTVTILQPTPALPAAPPPRTYEAPLASQTRTLSFEPIGYSLAADVDQVPPIELVVGIRDEPVISLGLLQFGQNGFSLLPLGVETGAEGPRQIRALHFDRAFPATSLSDEAKAVFIVHEAEVDGERERRLSTRLIAQLAPQQPLLLPPDAGDQLPFPIEGLVGGNFHETSVAGAGAVKDLALARLSSPTNPGDEIVLIANDGFGGRPRFSNRMPLAGLLPSSLLLLPMPGQIERLVVCDRDSRLAIWLHDPNGPTQQLPTALSAPLRNLIQEPQLAAAFLSDRTRLATGDVDGDGIEDLVVLMCFELPSQGEGQARLAVLRGNATPQPGEFPFFAPQVLTPLHGNASAIALGDFVNVGPDLPRRLELAVPVPSGTTTGALDGDHVRFFRYSTSTGGWQFSAEESGPQVLVAGSRPTLITAGDFDRDGRTDIMVACRGDSSLRWFRNTAPIDSAGLDVEVAAFVEGLASPRPLAGGVPTFLRLVDVNGDGSLDAVAFVEFTSAGTGTMSTTVATYLNSGAGVFDGPRFVSQTRLGGFSAALKGDLGDWNRDGVPDLFLGWTFTATSQNNLRVLFGGTR